MTNPAPAPKELLTALKLGKKAIDELFKELSNKQVGNWQIINEGCVAVERAISRAQGSAGEGLK